MKKLINWRYTKIIIGVVLTALLGASIPPAKAEADCTASENQTVVRWKDMYWFPCQYSWNGFCLWPIRRKHITYKVTVTEGVPIRDSEGRVIPIASGEKRSWSVYEAAEWNSFATDTEKIHRFPNHEPIADNEFVVLVETRYRLFNNVEANLRICTQTR